MHFIRKHYHKYQVSSVKYHTDIETDNDTDTGVSIMSMAKLVKAVVITFAHVGKRLRKSNPGAHLGCEVPLER